MSVWAFFVSAWPSYTFSPSALVSVTVRFAISSVPSTITNATFVKFLLVFAKSAAVSFMS